MRVVTIVGARPQFIKAAPLSVALAERGHEEIVVHTGQHYDAGMSDVFFEELPIARPRVNLGVGSGTPGWQVAEVLRRAEEEVGRWKPDYVIVYGDTNSTLGGALAANKGGWPLAHVEAGLRSWNRAMPEEGNRVLTDHASDLLLCPTRIALANLEREGLSERAVLVGDTMLDALLQFLPVAREQSALRAELGLEAGRFLLATVHRNYNTDDPQVLPRLFETLASLGEPVVLPLHPRTRERLRAEGGDLPQGGLRVIDPVSYFDMLALLSDARLVLTDSGGLQKEAYFAGTPCVTLRPETEWLETVESGWNTLAGSDPDLIRSAVRDARTPGAPAGQGFGDGKAAARIVDALEHAAD